MNESDSYRITLANVGHACIRVSRLGRISDTKFLDEAFTGSSLAPAIGSKLETLICYVDGATREPLNGHPFKYLPLGQTASRPPDTHMLNREGKNIGIGGVPPLGAGATLAPDQSLLLVTPPTYINGLQIAAPTRPSQSADGDFFLFIKVFRHLVGSNERRCDGQRDSVGTPGSRCHSKPSK